MAVSYTHLVRDAQPDAQIYIQSILPVSTEKSQKDKIYNNEKITQFNDCLLYTSFSS